MNGYYNQLTITFKINLTAEGNSPPTANALLVKKGLISSNSAVANNANDRTNKKYLNIL